MSVASSLRVPVPMPFVLVCCALSAGSADAQDVPDAKQIARGRELFVRVWEPTTKPGRERDGLGPMHNAASCAKCHFQGGVGGGGTAESSVDLLAVVPPDKKEDREHLRSVDTLNRLTKIHPGFGIGQLNLVLHRSGGDAEYANWRRLGERQTLYETQLLRTAGHNAEAALRAYQSGVTEFTTLMRARITELDVRLQDLRIRIEGGGGAADMVRALSEAALADEPGIALGAALDKLVGGSTKMVSGGG